MKAKQCSTAILVLTAILVTSGCGAGQIPKGVVKGIIVDKNNLALGPGVQVIPSARDESQNACMLSNDLIKKSTNTDDKGAFTFTDIAPGKYCLVIFKGDQLPLISGAILTNDHQLYIFEVPDAKGIDLGKVVMTGLRLP